MLELLVVLIIMALAGALVTPSITKGLEGTRLRGAASDLATFLKHARNLALARKIVYQVIVVPETQSAWLGALEEEPGQGDKRTGFHPASVAEVFTLPEGVLVKGEGPLFFAFFPTGIALGGTVELEGGGQSMKVHVDPVTGLVRIVR
ncbi:MAG: hypothetical protein HY347_03505 [candidate division NC10 bacterium]|nr:hypothetical protein [candidate division NC10 bacterium]